VGSKAAVLITLLRLLHQVFPESADQWQYLLWIASAATMIIGNVAALTQTDVKRLLAYSSIAHAGYILLGVIANSPRGAQGVLFYLAAYSLMTLGAFAVVQVFSRRDEQFTSLEDYRGIGYRHPLLSVSLTIFLLSLIGIPPTAGFYGKLFLFSAAVEADLIALVILAVLASAVGLYYYLQLIVLMFMKEASSPPEPVPIPLAARIVILLMAAGTLYLGVYPAQVLSIAGEAAGL
jgi:NADH-quinone oxidoreductase subunit N